MMDSRENARELVTLINHAIAEARLSNYAYTEEALVGLFRYVVETDIHGRKRSGVSKLLTVH